MTAVTTLDAAWRARNVLCFQNEIGTICAILVLCKSSRLAADDWHLKGLARYMREGHSRA